MKLYSPVAKLPLVGPVYVYKDTVAKWIKFGKTVQHGTLLGLDQDDHLQYLWNRSEDVPAPLNPVQLT